MFNLGQFLGTVLGNLPAATKAVHNMPTPPVLNHLFQAINSVNPLHAQPAISAESLRPQNRGDYDQLAPYEINGQVAPAPSWSILPQIENESGWSARMPQLLGQPDYTAMYNREGFKIPHPYDMPTLPPGRANANNWQIPLAQPTNQRQKLSI